MFGRAPIPLSDQAKARLNAALTLVVPQKQIPPQSETVAQISQLNADIGAFMEELGQLIDEGYQGYEYELVMQYKIVEQFSNWQRCFGLSIVRA